MRPPAPDCTVEPSAELSAPGIAGPGMAGDQANDPWLVSEWDDTWVPRTGSAAEEEPALEAPPQRLAELLAMAEKATRRYGKSSTVESLLDACEPSLLLAADSSGRVIAAEQFGCRLNLGMVQSLAVQMARRLGDDEACGWPYATDSGMRMACAMRMPEGLDVGFVGCLLKGGCANWVGEVAPSMAASIAGGAIAKVAMWQMAETEELRTRIRHLICEHDTLLASHSEAISEVLEERRERIRKQEENNALEALCQAVEEASNTKSEFLTNMSHEIRTPMTAILGFADLLLENLDNPEHIRAATTIKRNGEHLMEIINDILDLSKIEAGKFDIHHTRVSPVTVLADVITLMRIRADAKGLPLAIELDGPIPQTIETDLTRLRQILINLLGNAIKFTETGQVRVVIRLSSDNGHDPQLEWDVVDTGIGIAPEYLDRLFEPFTQGDASTSRKYGGTGLGLAISRRLAGMLGGGIDVWSLPGKGSTFRLRVATGPLEGVAMTTDVGQLGQGREKSSQQASCGAEPRLSGRILLAEDGPDNQRLISFILRKAGADVTIARNGKEAMEKVLATYPGWGRRWYDPSEPFDVVLMDMQMPVMDGYESVRRIRAEGYKGPIVALTAHAMSHEIQKCLEAGCDAHLAKPVDRHMLIESVAEHLAAWRRQQAEEMAARE